MNTQWNRAMKWTRYTLLPLFISGHLAAQPLAIQKSAPASKGKQSSCRPTGNNCFVENFTGPIVSTQPTDLLFVLETSNAMAGEMPAIRAGISQFVDSLPTAIDLQIGVMLAHGSTSSGSGRLYQSRGSEPLVLRTKDLSHADLKTYLNQKLTNPAQDPEAAGGDEGLFSIFNGIYSPSLLAASQAAGFFRPNASLSLVFLADQRDICAIPPAGVPAETDPVKVSARIRDCEGLTVQGLSNRLKQLKANQPLKVSGVIYTKAPVPAGSENEIGYGYIDIIQINGGSAIDLARDNISQGLLGTVAGSGSTLTEFTLSQSNVDPSSVTVSVNGQSIPFKLTDNKVTLTQMIPSGASVVIHYCVKTGNISTKAEKLAAIMTMSCPIFNKSYPAGYKAPTSPEIWNHLKACTAELYPETPTTPKQQSTLDRMLDPQDPTLRVKMFHKLWYSPEYSDHFEYYFGLEIKEAVQVFCLNNGGLTDTLITSEYAKAMYDQVDSWQQNPASQKRWKFAQSLRQQLLSCLNR